MSLRISSFARPYRCWILPSSCSRRPLITLRSSSVSWPHFSFTLPLICFQFPSTRFQSISYHLRGNDIGANAGLDALVPGTENLRRAPGFAAPLIPPLFEGEERA